MDPTAVNRKRNASTSSAPHQIALDPVQEENSENEHSDEESDDESLGTHLSLWIKYNRIAQLSAACPFFGFLVNNVHFSMYRTPSRTERRHQSLLDRRQIVAKGSGGILVRSGTTVLEGPDRQILVPNRRGQERKGSHCVRSDRAEEQIRVLVFHDQCIVRTHRVSAPVE